MSPLQVSERQPATLAGAIKHGLLLVAVMVGASSGVAYLISRAAGRGNAFGFYIIGATILAVAFLTTGTTTGVSGPSLFLRRVGAAGYSRLEREQRLNRSFGYMLVGAIVVGIGIAIEVLSR